MNLPRKRLSIEQFDVAIAKGVKERYNEDPTTKHFTCKKCGGLIVAINCIITIHRGKECKGGKTRLFRLPTCMKCEGLPNRTTTCVHITK
jgi:hypothetical protein